MKKSTAVTLVLSGSLLAGCDDSPPQQGAYSSGGVITNNTYSPQYGYWHAPYRDWYPHPYNFYQPGSGYYYGGRWGATPEVASVMASTPVYRSPVGGSSFGSSSGFGSGAGSYHSSGSTSRGGFGSSGHSSS